MVNAPVYLFLRRQSEKVDEPTDPEAAGDARAAARLRLGPALAGDTVKELAAHFGHNDPGFTLRTHTHLVPSSFERARIAVDGVFPSAS